MSYLPIVWGGRIEHPGAMTNHDPSTEVPESMFAWLTDGHGTDTLRRTAVAVPSPGEHEVLLRMRAWSLNYRDLLVINGEDGWSPPSPVVPLSDGVGVVVARGDGVTRFDLGDRVSPMFLPHWQNGELSDEKYVMPVGGPVNRGLLAEYVVVQEDEGAEPPRTLTTAEAATLPVAALTAWHAVVVRGQVEAGQTVLVHGTGGVALHAIQLATALGARVAVTSSSEEKLARARALGAEHIIDYRRDDVAQSVLDWTDGRGVDHVVETVGGENLNVSLRSVRVGGSISFIGLIAGLSASINTYDFVTRNVTIHGVETGSREMYEQLTAFVDKHGIRPVVDSVSSATSETEVAKALHRLESGGAFGKLVLVAE